mmetsp:Transcript_33637/g.101559  ORF Transcript_33637/g.101559 Transcript_33637/m.101559 type:complete len:312 (-) Transcript_33637:25-960(-)
MARSPRRRHGHAAELHRPGPRLWVLGVSQARRRPLASLYRCRDLPLEFRQAHSVPGRAGAGREFPAPRGRDHRAFLPGDGARPAVRRALSGPAAPPLPVHAGPTEHHLLHVPLGLPRLRAPKRRLHAEAQAGRKAQEAPLAADPALRLRARKRLLVPALHPTPPGARPRRELPDRVGRRHPRGSPVVRHLPVGAVHEEHRATAHDARRRLRTRRDRPPRRRGRDAGRRRRLRALLAPEPRRLEEGARRRKDEAAAEEEGVAPDVVRRQRAPDAQGDSRLAPRRRRRIRGDAPRGQGGLGTFKRGSPRAPAR